MVKFRCVVMVSLVREDTFITDCEGYRAYRADPRTSQHFLKPPPQRRDVELLSLTIL